MALQGKGSAVPMIKQLLSRAVAPSFADTMASLERQFQRQERRHERYGRVVTSPEEVSEVLAPNYDPNDPANTDDAAPRRIIAIVAGTACYVFVYAAGILHM